MLPFLLPIIALIFFAAACYDAALLFAAPTAYAMPFLLFCSSTSIRYACHAMMLVITPAAFASAIDYYAAAYADAFASAPCPAMLLRRLLHAISRLIGFAADSFDFLSLLMPDAFLFCHAITD